MQGCVVGKKMRVESGELRKVTEFGTPLYPHLSTMGEGKSAPPLVIKLVLDSIEEGERGEFQKAPHHDV